MIGVAGSGAILLAVMMAKNLDHLFLRYFPREEYGSLNGAVTQEMIAKLKPGMSRSQVRFALVTPLIVDPFRTDRWDYVYMLHKQGQLAEQRQVTVIFSGDQLARIEADVVAGANISAPPADGKAAVPAAQEKK